MTKFYLLPIIAAVLLVQCRSASKAYNQGDYADAIELGVKKVQKDPSDAETVALVKSAYGFAVSQYEADIRSLSTASGDSRYGDILNRYNRLQDLYATINQSPVLTTAIRPNDYSNYVQTYRDKIADQHLESAEGWMNKGTKQGYRNAYNEFRVAQRYRDNTAIRAKRDEAYNLALTKILVSPIRNYGSYSYHTDYQLERFQSAVVRTLANRMNDGFVRFYGQWEARVNDIEPDEILEMTLGRVVIGQPYDQRSQRTATKQVVVKEIVYRPDSVVKQYANVQAAITTTNRTLLSQGDLYITLRDVQGRVLWQDRFTGQHRWQTSFATYTGDDRALTDSDRATLSRNNNQLQPREDDIMQELYRQIENDLSQRISNYYSRY